AWGQALFAPGGGRGTPERSRFGAVLPALAALLAFDVSFLVTCLHAFGRLPPGLADPRGGPVLLYGATAAVVAARALAPSAFGLLAVATLALALDLSNAGSGMVSAAASLVAVLAATSPESAALLLSSRRSAASALSAIARWNEGPLDADGAARVDWVLFERGGVLSAGAPAVKRIVPLKAGTSELDVLEAAALAEYTVRNPLRDAIVSIYRSGRRTVSKLEAAQYLPGRGVRRSLAGEDTLVGNVRLFRDAGWRSDGLRFLEETARALSAGGETVIFVAAGDEVLGALAVFDPPRPEAAACLEALGRMGVEAAMASGDASFSVAAWAKALPRIEVHAEADPADRRALLEARRSQGRRVAVVRRRTASGAPVEGGSGPSLEWGFDRSPSGFLLRTLESGRRRHVLIEEEGLRGVVAFLARCRGIRRRERWAAASIVAYHAAALPLVSGVAFGWAGIPALPALAGTLGALLPSALSTPGSRTGAVPASGPPRTPTRVAEARVRR
ncbi:MAG: HAD family hydrolase, partial [Planctomycetota bacterium]